jgi:hypothetical protein
VTHGSQAMETVAAGTIAFALIYVAAVGLRRWQWAGSLVRTPKSRSMTPGEVPLAHDSDGSGLTVRPAGTGPPADTAVGLMGR